MPDLLEKREERKELTDPLRWFDWMRDEIDRLFDTNVPRLAPMLPRASKDWIPAIEVFEKDGLMHVKADLPGLKKEDVAVDVTADGLTISGERKSEMKEEKEGYFRTERRYGAFRRFIPLPEDAVLDKASAQFKDGVLEITMPVPKREKLAAKHIEIK